MCPNISTHERKSERQFNESQFPRKFEINWEIEADYRLRYGKLRNRVEIIEARFQFNFYTHVEGNRHAYSIALSCAVVLVFHLSISKAFVLQREMEIEKNDACFIYNMADKGELFCVFKARALALSSHSFSSRLSRFDGRFRVI